MRRLLAASALIAIIVLSVVAVTVSILLVSYVLGYTMKYSRTEYIVVDDAKYLYFMEKPRSILNRCEAEPCGFILMHVYASERTSIIQIRFGSYIWDMRNCMWETTFSKQLDTGDNIILLRNPSFVPPCMVVSKKANPRLYAMFYDILIKKGDLELLDNFERIKVLQYSDLRVENVATPQWANIITDRNVYQILVQPVLLR